MFNFFNNKKLLKNKFDFDENSYIEIGDFSNVEEVILDESDNLNNLQKLNLDSNIYSNFTKNKLIIKTFSFEDNLDISKFLSGKVKKINKGIEVFKNIKKDIEIKGIGDVNIAGIESIQVQDKTIELKEKELINLVYKGESLENVLILDLLDLIYLGEAFLNRKRRDYIYVAITGQAIDGNKILKVKIGESLEAIFNKLNGNEKELYKIINGGFIKGIPKKSLMEKIEGTERGLIFLTERETNIGEEMPCIRCGKCLKACREKLSPIKLVDLYKSDDKEEFIKFGGMKCIECGLCTLVCPSNIEISHKIKVGKIGFREKEEIKVRSESFV